MATALSAVRFGWPAYVVPFLFVLSPTLLMQGDTVSVLLAARMWQNPVWKIIFDYLPSCLSLP